VKQWADKWTGKHLEGGGCGLMKVLFWTHANSFDHLSGGTGVRLLEIHDQ
jgi:hypothetical protein